MTRRVSIITAAYGPKADYLDEAMRSVLAQNMPNGWEFEWIVQEDGTDPQLADTFANVPNIRYAANHAQVGTAATRNLALSRATGELVQVLDHDDILFPTPSERSSGVLTTNRILGGPLARPTTFCPTGTATATSPPSRSAASHPALPTTGPSTTTETGPCTVPRS